MAAVDSTVKEASAVSHFAGADVNVLGVMKFFENAVIAFHLFIMFKRAAVNWMKVPHCIRIVVMTLFKMKGNPLFLGHRTISECDEQLAKSSVKFIDDLSAHSIHKCRTGKIGELYIFTKSVELAALLVVSRCMAFFTHSKKFAETIAVTTLPVEHVMHMQNCTFISLAPANLAGIFIAIKNRFT